MAGIDAAAPDNSLFLPREIEKTPATRNNAKRLRSAVQTSLDFGQSNVDGVATCGLCGMIFNVTVEEDVRLHRRCCAASSRKKGSRQFADCPDAWLSSEQLSKALDSIAGPRRRRGCAAKEFCTRVQESADDEFIVYVLDCSGPKFAEDAVVRQLLEALQFFDLLFAAAAYTLVVVMHRRAGRLLCAVAGRPSTREQDPALVLRPGGDGAPTRCHTQSCVTLCDVPYVWCQRDAALAASSADWWTTQTASALRSTRSAVRDFFCRGGGRVGDERERLRGLVDSALRRALRTLGRRVAYGHALCPRLQFSYDRGALRDDVLSRLDAVTSVGDSGALYTHDDGAVDSGDGLSVVSYGD